MKYQKYPVYKDSGVEWIGEIPERWKLTKFKRVAKTEKGKLNSTLVYGPLLENYIPYLSMEYLRSGVDPIQWVPKDDTSVIANKGDILLLWDGSNAGEFLNAKYGAVSSTIALVKLKNINRGFFFYWCKIIESQIQELTVGMGIPHVDGNILKDFITILPSIDEQYILSNFLDSQTSKIDSLISNLQKMIELLKEKRQALITHAVTKGLDPNVPTKDSGVEWIGEIPSSWNVVQTKWLMSCNDEVIPENSPSSFELTYVEISDVDFTRGITNRELMRFEDAPSRARRKVRDGDIIISTVRTYLKAIAEIKAPDNNLVVSTGFAVLRPRKVLQSFAKYALSASYFIEKVISESFGVSYPAITADRLVSIKLAVPDIKTQEEIADLLDKQTMNIDSLVKKQEEMIDLLREHRFSLISSAVTGKIEVRNLKINEISESNKYNG